jgi:hypothetical protein
MSSTPPSQQSDEDWQVPSSADSASGKWEDEPAPARPKRPRPRPQQRATRPTPANTSLLNDPAARPLLAIGGVALLGMCGLACMALALLLYSGLPSGVGGLLPDSEAVKKETPSLPSVPVTQTIRGPIVSGTPVAPGLPSRINIGSRTFDVEAIGLDDNREWQYDPNNKRVAYWSAGTLVNYVIGLHASTDNRELYDVVQPNELITLETGAGVLRYRVIEKVKIKTDELALMSNQSSPRLTLIMLGQSGEERDALVAQYTDEGTPNQQMPIGAPINLGDARVIAVNAGLVPGGSAGLTEGKNYYQIDFRVTNVQTGFINVADFFTELSDGQGSRYQLSVPGSSASGAAGWPVTSAVLAPGETVTATAGFEVPSSMQGPFLEWNFALKPGNPYVARVAIGYEALVLQPTLLPTAQARVRVDIADAFISPDGNELTIVGTLSNLTDQPVPVSLQDAQLATADGAQFPVNASLPGLPWEVNPQGQLTFRISFAKPATLPATFTLMKQSYSVNAN